MKLGPAAREARASSGLRRTGEEDGLQVGLLLQRLRDVGEAATQLVVRQETAGEGDPIVDCDTVLLLWVTPG